MNPIKSGVVNNFIPTEFYLSQNNPNPFKEKTIIKYCVAYKTRIKITVFNSDGELIEKLIDEEKEPGTYEVEFQLAIRSEQPARGSYYYRLEAGEYICEKKMELIK